MITGLGVILVLGKAITDDYDEDDRTSKAPLRFGGGRMQLLPIDVNCPNCGSAAVTYTCEPKCCFNHLCGDCYCTFELVTKPSGERAVPEEKPRGERDSLAPTAPCAVCGSLEVFLAGEEPGRAERLVCVHCWSWLELRFEGIQPA